MKSCNRCGSNLEKRGHSISCPLGNVLREIGNQEPVSPIQISFPNDDAKHGFGDMMARTAQMMMATKTFFDAACEMDENSPDLANEIGPYLEKFVVDLVLIYPSNGQFDADLKTLLGKEIKQ